MALKYSVVIPLKNEEENIVDLIQELEPIMNSLKQPYEIICIDDGSTDNTLKYLKNLKQQKSFLRILSFKENYGQSSAFDAGFKTATGEFIITLDGDRQNDPTDIPKLVQECQQYDLVCGYRANRKDPWSKKITSLIANTCRNFLCEDGVQDTGCSLKVYKSNSLKQIKLFNGMHRFLPALFVIEGFKIKEIPVNHRPRVYGKTKYNFFNRSFNTLFDLFAVRWMKKRHLKYQIKEN